jgi:hypothetical protein
MQALASERRMRGGRHMRGDNVALASPLLGWFDSIFPFFALTAHRDSTHTLVSPAFALNVQICFVNTLP